MNILLIDPFPAKMIAQLEALGHPVRYEPDWTRAQVLAGVADVDILVMNSKVNADAALLAAGPRLRMICRAGVGMDHFDLPLLAARGIEAFNTPGANAIPVAEQAVGMLLALMHHIVRANAEVHDWQWQRERNRGTELYGKTVGIIGYGNTGSAVGRCLSGFGCRLLAYDKYKTDLGDLVEETDLAHIQREADILTLHIPLTDETGGWINAEFLSQFRKPIYLLNLARGPIVPLAELVRAMDAGHVVAAGLDVLENERLDTLTPAQRASMENLLARDRVIFTPHIGGWSHESLDRINDRLVAGVAAFLARQSADL